MPQQLRSTILHTQGLSWPPNSAFSKPNPKPYSWQAAAYDTASLLRPHLPPAPRQQQQQQQPRGAAGPSPAVPLPVPPAPPPEKGFGSLPDAVAHSAAWARACPEQLSQLRARVWHLTSVPTAAARGVPL